jgi:beta-mannosidase
VNVYSLDGDWTLYHFPQGERDIRTPEELRRAGLSAVPAKVPGNVELDLMAAGELPDVLQGNHIRALRPLETHEWWYERTFPTPEGMADAPVELRFHGVDCHAVYWLNGRELGRSDNMFIEHVFDVTGLLVSEGVNTLTIRLTSPIIEAMNKPFEPSMYAMTTDNWPQLWIRKAAHSFGWDIMPRALGFGLWRSVELVRKAANEITDWHWYTRSANEHHAWVGIHYDARLETEQLDGLEIRCFGASGSSSFDVRKPIRFKTGLLEFEVRRPELWWPRGYGEANLYRVTTQLIRRGQVIAERTDRVGIRTIELVRTETTTTEKPGEFLFRVNGTPILVKGTNWVPADLFHSRDAAKYERLIGLAADLECNMIRCWGGNVYEDHAFFELCDANGIMVWQDFAMACGLYPQSAEFQEQLRAEAVSVVKKLRNHPSLALWCGDNECDEFYLNRGIDPNRNVLTREVLPSVVLRLDPYRPYVPSSPYVSPEAMKLRHAEVKPEAHLWGPRDYFKSRYYTESRSHFIGEIGYHGCPNLSSIKRFIDPDHLWPYQNNEQWITHCTDAIGPDGPFAYRVQLMADQIRELFGIQPDRLEDFILASQISQAEAKKFFIEMTRLRKWRRTGVLWWNLIDGWPQFSDAVVDYYGGKKLAYAYIRRVQQPICVMMDEMESWHVRAYIGNDTRRDALVNYRIWDADSGETLLEGETTAQAGKNVPIGAVRVSHGEHRLLLMQWTAGGKTCGNHYLHGFPPFRFDQYRKWLRQIAALQHDFDADRIGL